jgi:AcrR family transcriptional regulator
MTGVAEGTVFYHFGSKEKLLLAVLGDIRRRFQEQFSAYFETTEVTSGLAMLEETASFYLQLATEQEDLFLLLHRSDAYELARSNQGYRAELEAIFDSLVGIFERALVQGQEDGSMEPMATRNMALLIFNMVDGLVRLRNIGLYEAGAVFSTLMDACRRLVVRTDATE